LAAVDNLAADNGHLNKNLADAARIVEMDDMVLQKALMRLTGPPSGARPDLWELFLKLLPRL